MSRSSICLSLSLLIACLPGGGDVGDDTADGGGDVGDDTADGGGTADPGVGTCVHYGDPDSEGPVAKNCIEATGATWTVESFQYACEQDWDAHGTHEADEGNCPTADLVGTCVISNGGSLIGASYEDEGGGYAGVLFYYPESRWEDPESHCGLGTYTPAR